MSANETNGYPVAGDIIDGKYQIERMLGEGGMGAVARAVHLLLRAPVALKFMNPQFMTFPGAVERFLNEGVASKAIKSEHVVQVDDVGKLPSGAPYLVMDCLDGCDLSELLLRDGKPGLEIERTIHFVVQILRGLQVAHAIGIIHRDMKPSNCFCVKHEGQPDFVKILDFGISKVQQPGSASLTQTNSALGTPLYMSPEQARSPRDVDARSDIYSVGVILYELLSGHTPFNSESGEFTEILFKLFTADVPRIEAGREDISKELADAVHKSLAREVADRYQNALAFAEGLAPFAAPRTLTLIERMKHFTPESRSSIIPRGENSPSSALAFSALGASPRSVVDIPPPPRIAVPVHGSTQASQVEATAKTQISSHDLSGHVPTTTRAILNQPQAQGHVAAGVAAAAPQPAMPEAPQQLSAVRTNLAVARDTTEAEVEEETRPPKRSPFVYAIAAVPLLAIAVIAVVARGKDTPKQDPAVGMVQGTTTGVPSASPLPAGSQGTDTVSANPNGATNAAVDAGAVANANSVNGAANAANAANANGADNRRPPNTPPNGNNVRPPPQQQQQPQNPHSSVLDNNAAQ